ncbi:uncharacterized protein GGS22DRAFT_200296 [Annulohypoxylon maeteangense]|uniref:uncharacterized protein n=1 Tax=Annulohypoxylon maeteangense TaxID=1927788 RepID=UPI00200736CA|nr:uncharacterized protein GGS22DRAFT_200296 [Annulohypoxylon maeteangense]KAI0885416.1 hypothetical protein GGS22DRAFT_200296 [Annulohypoxylon maeteangense]
MSDQQRAVNEASEQETSVEDMWDAAAKAFQDICGESLQRGDVKELDDVKKKIEGISKASYDVKQKDKWDKAKSAGLSSLKYLRALVGVASQAASIIPVPASAVTIASTALCIVFDIPEAIKGYNDAIDQVFSEVSSALSQFEVFASIQNIHPELIRRIHLVMTSLVKLCAHVVKYRQGRKRDRILQQVKSIFDDDSGLSDEMAKFKKLLQQQHDVEGTVTLAMVAKTNQDVAILREQHAVSGKTTEETHQLVREAQKDVQSFKNDADRIKRLTKIRNALEVWPTVRLDTNTTKTCTDICKGCYNRTGSWIWTHDAYTTWIAPNKDKESSHILILSGPASSGKTSASALITKRLEEQKGRTYVAHYFFPPSIKKSDDEKDLPVHSALKYMAFQIARVDPTVQKPLGETCDAGSGVFRRSASLETLDALWGDLKIGTPVSGATYYLIFDGLENLPYKQVDILLKFVFGSKLTDESAGRVRILVSGTDDQFVGKLEGVNTSKALRIRMEKHNGLDMRIVVDEALTKRGMLERPKPGSEQQRARDKIVQKLPQIVNGSYSRLQFGLDDVVRLLSTRTTSQELDRMLGQPMSSHEAAIKNLQRSLTADEIGELNELLKWVLFCKEPMTLDQLEAAMFLYSGTESLASLQFIIKNKYSAVLKLENGYVYGQDGVKDYLQKDKDMSGKASHSKDRSTISMKISINNVDQELCAHFLWDLAHKAIREKFKFDFDATSPNSALYGSNQAAIAADEFEAHHTIVTRAFEYLDKEHEDRTKDVGNYLVGWLPYHLNQLRQLEDEEKGALTPSEQIDIGQSLYKLFKDEKIVLRHKTNFELTRWFVGEMEDMQKWLMDSAVVRKLDKKWRSGVQLLISPTRSFLKDLVKVIVEGLLRARSWEAQSSYGWINEFMKLDIKFQQTNEHLRADEKDSSRSVTPLVINSPDDIDWDRASAWCQNFLGLPDSELNSLWYERLAEASSLQYCKADTVLSLYARAIEKDNPSWLCYRGLGQTCFKEGWTQKAIAHMERALQEAKQEGAMPKPEVKDIMELYLLLGQYAYEGSDGQKAADYYKVVCESEDSAQAQQGQLGYLKAGLSFLDAKVMRHLLEGKLANDGKEGTMVSVLKTIAQDTEHDMIMSKIFSVAKDSPYLLEGIVRDIETATAPPVLNENHLLANDEVRGVLLYDRGVAAYTYNVSSDGTDAVREALRLWEESRDLLSNIGGQNPSIARRDATTALAKHYFQDMMDGNHLDHVSALARLTEAESSSYVYDDDTTGFLGTVYARQNMKKNAREVLVGWMRQAFRTLSDDILENDMYGYSIISRTLNHYLDFGNAAIALSLAGTPDLVTDKLYFEAKDIAGDDNADNTLLLDIVNKLAKETIEVAKVQVPNFSQQTQRIEAAKAHIDSLIAEASAKAKPEADKPESQDEPTASELKTASALSLIHTRLSTLQQIHSSKIDVTAFWWWSCDGRNPDGRHCKNTASFEREFYHCIYCANRDFCAECLARLRAPTPDSGITVCSAKHRWMRIPPQGDDMYVGLKTKTVRVPKEVKGRNGDEGILEIYYDENGSEEITVEAWKEALAKEWDISLEDIRKEVSRQDAPDKGGEDEKKSEA